MGSVGLRGYSTHTLMTVSWSINYLAFAESFDWVSTGILSLYIIAVILFDLQRDWLRRTVLGVAARAAVERGPARPPRRRHRIGGRWWVAF